MPTYEFTAPDGKSYEVGAPEGATQAQAFDMLQQQIGSGAAPATKEPSTTVSAGRMLGGIPRQLGLTARYALTGAAETAQLLTEPIRYATDRILGTTGKTAPAGVLASRAADAMGLPSPETPLERTVGEGTKLGFGAAVPLGGAQDMLRRSTTAAGDFIAETAPKALTAGQNVLRNLTGNPGAQIASAAGAGLAGGASKEAGQGPLEQGVSALVGGVLGGLSVAGINSAIKQAQRVGSAISGTRNNIASIDEKLSQILAQQGTEFQNLAPDVQRALRVEVGQALRTGGQIDAAALDRLAAFKSVGATPTRGMLTQDPVQITREMNLAKTGANSAEPNLHRLAELQNTNNTALIGRMNQLGAGAGTEPIAAGRTLTGSIISQQGALRASERAAWNAVENSPGYTQPISPAGLNDIYKALDKRDLTGFLDPQISKYMQDFQTGARPFTPQNYANLRSLLSAEQASGGKSAMAASEAVKALDAMPINPITNAGGRDFGTAPVTAGLAGQMRAHDAQPSNAIDLINQARAATRAAYQYEGSTPLVRSVLGEGRNSDPARVAQSFIINGTPDEAREVAQHVGDAGRQSIREAMLTHIKRAALSGKEDETGTVSQSALNRALRGVGEEKLRLFFTPEEVTQLRNVSRVASLMQSQPAGSAVNNSNSGALALGRGLDMLGKVPFVGPGVDFGVNLIRPAVKTTIQGRQATSAQNVPQSLIRLPQRALPGESMGPLLLPAAAAAGSLLTPKD